MVCFCIFSLLWVSIVLMKATFPTGESKKSSKPRPQTRPVSEREHFPTGARQLQQYQTGDGRGGEGRGGERGWGRVKIAMKVSEGEREERSARFYFYLPQVVSRLEWRRRSTEELCWKARAHKLFHNLGTHQAAESQCVCACVCDHEAIIITASHWLPRRARATSPHCDIWSCADLFFNDILFPYFGSNCL